MVLSLFKSFYSKIEPKVIAVSVDIILQEKVINFLTFLGKYVVQISSFKL